MRMSAETMRRNGEVYSVARDLLNSDVTASVEVIANVSGYSTRDVEKALASLKSQKVVSEDLGVVSEVHPFRCE
jgi:hypothetical protein